MNKKNILCIYKNKINNMFIKFTLNKPYKHIIRGEKVMKKVEKEDLKKANKEVQDRLKKGRSEFKEFIMRGDVVDLAVGVIVGGAFGKIVTSLVNDILMPIIGVIIGGIDFSNLSIDFIDAKIMYGSFIQQVIDFLIVSFCIFVFVKVVTRFTRKEEEKEEKIEEVKKSEEVLLLEEIRDLLKDKKE